MDFTYGFIIVRTAFLRVHFCPFIQNSLSLGSGPYSSEKIAQMKNTYNFDILLRVDIDKNVRPDIVADVLTYHFGTHVFHR